MARITVLVLAVLAAVVAIQLFTSDRGGGPVGEPGGGETETPTEVPIAAGAEVTGRGEPVAAVDEAAADAERTAVDTRHLAVIRGRCVDEDGAPLAGVAVELRGWPGDSKRMDRYRLDHGEVVWDDPADVVTDADGRFEHRFDPPPPYQFVCEPDAEGRVRVYGRWGVIEPGATVDMGDVVLAPGVAVAGRVVDESGAGLANRSVSLRKGEGPRVRLSGGWLTSRDFLQTRTDASGFFEAHWPLPPGAYSVEVRECVVKEPAGAVEMQAPRADLRIVAAVPPPDTRPTIEGVVVDARGAPVSNARILLGDDWFNGPQTGSGGSFVVKQSERVSREPVVLGVDAEGFVTWHASEPVDWGTHGLRIELTAGPPLTIRVQRDDGAAVERFGIMLAPIWPNGGWSSRDRELKHLGEHPGGLLEISRTSTGRFRFAVVPAESTGLPCSPDREIEIEPGVPVHLDVAIAPEVERAVEVVTTRGEPARDVRVELLWYRGSREVTLQMTAMPIETARINSPEHVAVLEDQATTDAEGRVTLRGRPDGALALRLPGPGHVPALVSPFSMTDEGVARVVVGVGGTLRGRVEPVDVLASLREEAGLPAEGPVDDRRLDWLPSITLFRTGPDGRETFPADRSSAKVRLAEDGGFEVAGVPPGTWDVLLSSFRAHTAPGLGFSGTGRSRVAATGVEIAEGEVREVAIDLSSWRRQPVTIGVRLDGGPLTGRLALRGTLVGPPGVPEKEDYRYLDVQAQTEVETALPQGSWKVSAEVRVGDVRASLPGPTFVVGAGDPVHVDVDLRLAACPVVVQGPDGEPVPDVVLYAEGVGTGWRLQSKPTDAAGCTTLLGPPGAVSLRARRRPLADDRAYSTWAQEHRGDPDSAARVFVDLGRVTLTPGATAPQTIRLPPEWLELPK